LIEKLLGRLSVLLHHRDLYEWVGKKRTGDEFYYWGGFAEGKRTIIPERSVVVD